MLRTQDAPFISYAAIEDQMKSMPILNDFIYDSNSRMRYRINDIISELPKFPNVVINVSPLFEHLKARYVKVIRLAKNRKYNLSDLYKELFSKLWTEKNIIELKKAMKIALNQGKITVSTHYHIDDFLKDLTWCKKRMESIIAKIPGESKEEYLSMEQELIQERAIQTVIEKSNVKTWLFHLTEEMFSQLPKDHKLHATASDFEKMKVDLQSMIDFINKYQAEFPQSFKEKIKQSQVEAYINEYYSPKLPEEMMEILCPPVNHSDKVNITYDYKKIRQDFTDMHGDWEYVASLDNTLLKDFYRVVALHESIEKDLSVFYSMWHEEVDDLLIKKSLTPEAQIAVVQASLGCMVKMNYYQEYLHGFVNPRDKKCDMPEPVRNKILAKIMLKEPEYYAMMPREFRDKFEYADKSFAKTLFLRLIAVNYIRNKLLSGEQVKSRQVTDELIEQFGDDIVATRGWKKSRIKKILEEIGDIPAMTTMQGFFAKSQVKNDSHSRWSLPQHALSRGGND